MNKLSILALAAVLVFAGCKKSDDDDDSTPGTRSASFKVNGTVFTVSKPYLGIFNDNGTIKNTMSLEAADGSEIELKFTGSTPNTYTLQSFSEAVYTNAAGKQYNATTGIMTTSSYTISGAVYKTTGIFQFNATAIVAPNDSVVISEGIFTNASNEL